MSEADTRRRVLIVDDEPTTSETRAFIFSRHGYEVRYAGSAEEATRMIADWVPEFTLIDVMLPGKHGITLAIAITANHPGCRILLFTGDMASAELLLSRENKVGEFQLLPKRCIQQFCSRQRSVYFSGRTSSLVKHT